MTRILENVIALTITCVVFVWVIGCVIFTRNEKRNY